MNAKELIEAAERINEEWNVNRISSQDLQAVLNHILATVREDDDEPVTRELVDKLRARIEALEGLGPLIEEYASSKRYVGVLVEREKYEEAVKWLDKYEATFSKIDAILKGGATEQCHEIAKGGAQ